MHYYELSSHTLAIINPHLNGYLYAAGFTTSLGLLEFPHVLWLNIKLIFYCRTSSILRMWRTLLVVQEVPGTLSWRCIMTTQIREVVRMLDFHDLLFVRLSDINL